MLKNLSISKKALLVVVGLLSTQLIFVTMLGIELYSLRKNLEEEHQIKSATGHLNQYAHLLRRETQELGSDSAMGLTPDVESRRRYSELIEKERIAVVEALGPDSIERKFLERLEVCRKKSERSFFDEPLNFKKQITLMKDMMPICEELRKHSLTERPGQRNIAESIQQLDLLLILGLALNIFIVVITANFFKTVTARLGVITENVSRAAKQEPLLPALTGDDEIARIDSVFHQLSRALIDAAEKERSLFEKSADVMCSLDSKGTFLEVSPSAREQWGYRSEDLIGEEAARILDTDRFSQVFSDTGRPVWRDSQFSFEDKLKRIDGKRIDSSWVCHWSSADGSLFCFVRDNTEEKNLDRLLIKQEAEVRTAIENMPLGIITIDAMGVIQSVNKETMRLFGQDGMVGKNIESFLSLYVDQKHSELLHALSNLQPMASLRCQAQAQDGGQWQADVSSFQERTRDEKDRVLILEDVSERVMLDELKRNFVTLLGKSLREPLDQVRSIVSKRIDEGDYENKTAQRLNRVLKNLDRLMRLIDDLLNVQQLQSGKLTGTLTPCAVQDIAQTAVEVVKDHAEQQKIEIVCDSSESFVMADSSRLVQVLVNLLTNAIKFSPAQTTINIELPCVSDYDVVEIRIVDRGRGMSEDMQKSIFRPYVQSEAQDARRGSGTGLGLSISKQIVELHDGTIGVESKEGKGSTFWIRLPRARRPD